MKQDHVIALTVVAAGAAAVVLLRSKKAAAAAVMPSAVPARARTKVVTAPVPVTRPVKVKGPSLAKQVASTAITAGAQFGCSHLNGYQKTLCQQGTGIIGNGIMGIKF